MSDPRVPMTDNPPLTAEEAPLADAMYECCIEPPRTDHADHVLAALRRNGWTLATLDATRAKASGEGLRPFTGDVPAGVLEYDARSGEYTLTERLGPDEYGVAFLLFRAVTPVAEGQWEVFDAADGEKSIRRATPAPAGPCQYCGSVNGETPPELHALCDPAPAGDWYDRDAEHFARTIAQGVATPAPAGPSEEHEWLHTHDGLYGCRKRHPAEESS